MSDEALKKLEEIHIEVRKLTDKHVTRKELAEKFEVDPVTIDNYVKHHGLKRLKNGRFPLRTSLDWLYEYKGRKA